MACGCVECTEHGGPDPKIMYLRFFFIGMQVLIAVAGMIKERSWKSLLAFSGAFAVFATVPRRLICARCDNYGKMCYSLYLGKITSMYLPKGEGDVDFRVGVPLEALCLATITNAPVIGLWRNKKLLLLYMLFANLTGAFQFSHACKHCGQYASDWRSDCPSAKLALKVFGPGVPVCEEAGGEEAAV